MRRFVTVLGLLLLALPARAEPLPGGRAPALEALTLYDLALIPGGVPPDLMAVFAAPLSPVTRPPDSAWRQLQGWQAGRWLGPGPRRVPAARAVRAWARAVAARLPRLLVPDAEARLAALIADPDSPLTLAVPPPAREAMAGIQAANAALVAALRVAGSWPDADFDTALGRVRVGTAGPDQWGPADMLIMDPGGDDHYALAPAIGGVRLILDRAGDDSYDGPDLAAFGVFTLIDLAGDDRHHAVRGGQAAALGGVALLYDGGGDDLYEARRFAQGFARFGNAALVEAAGNDQYRLGDSGQALGHPGGAALLWDMGGDDLYVAEGQADPAGRGGSLTFAQGVGAGQRAALPGGIGLLRDDRGDDQYQAGMYAQGAAYWLGRGVLDDRRGDDRYQAWRYAQGQGTHRGFGLLRDGGGDDSYSLGYGVGQGMGLDLAVGLLLDMGGADRYEGGNHVQGSSTANGFGGLIDRGAGADHFIFTGASGWGQNHWARGLPGRALLRGLAPGDVLEGPDGPLDTAGLPADGPRAARGWRQEQQPVRPCTPPPAGLAMDGGAMGWREALTLAAPTWQQGQRSLDAYAALRAHLADWLPEILAAITPADTDAALTLRAATGCILVERPALAAATAQAAADWLAADPASVQAWLAPSLLGPPGGAGAGAAPAVIGALLAHPACSIRVEGLKLARRWDADAPRHYAAAWAAAARSPCPGERQAAQKDEEE